MLCAWRGASHSSFAYPKGMSSLPLTLAALATSAVPGLTAVAVRPHHSLGSDFVAAILTTEEDEIILSIPRNQQAETTQSASVLGLSALSDGARTQLPFAVPHVLGMTRAGETRAVASTYLPGFHFDVSDLEADALLIASIAESISAIHALPGSIAQHGGLPDRSAQDQRLLIARVVDRTSATRYLPKTVLSRWTEVLEAAEVWDFAPRIVHGTLSGDTLLVEDDRVIGVLDWSGLALGDPASDLSWLIEAGLDVFEAVTSRYFDLGHGGDAKTLRSRAMLYHELEIARWLLHGVDTHNTEIIDDAVAMLDQLVDRLSLLEAPLAVKAQFSESDAIELLEHTPDLPSPMSDTASYEALDEDRMFGVDTDFIDPLPEDTPSGHDGTDESEVDPDFVDSSEQATEQISDDDLPTPKR